MEKVFIGAGCNRIVNNVSWGASGLVAFGARNAVAIFCPNTSQILTTLPGHKAVVNCTQWLPGTKNAFKAQQLESHFLLSGDADGVIIVWELTLKDGKWRHVLQVPEAHKKGVTCISGIMVSQTVAIFASTSSDGSVYVWEMVLPLSAGGDCKLLRLDSLILGSKSMVALSLAELPGASGHILIAMGGLDNKVHLYCGERTGKFVHACELKGHTDWIRCLDFSLPMCSNDEKDSLLLVSSSQDRSIRLWKLALHSSPANSDTSQKKTEISLASYIEGPVLMAGSKTYQISLESLLIGHEDWVYSVEWRPPSSSSSEGNGIYQSQSILSASMDKTMMIWQPEKTTGIWMNVVTVGELSHCALGFYGGHWSPCGDSILAHGYGGSFHLWKNVGVDFDNWQPQKVPSGHFAAVTDVAWARSGEYLLSVSHDQTTRIFAPWKNESGLRDCYSWHEIARPQVHGHDINCVTIIQGKGNHRFVGGADEKVARVFEAPLSFLKTLNHAAFQKSNVPDDVQEGIQILGANMSALGLSQKPIYLQARSEAPEKSGNDAMDTIETIPDAVPTAFTEPPIEEQLSWHTLWPESHKLYGHGNELFSLCCDHEGKLVASTCKAQSATVAEIWLWQVGSWKAIGRLNSHSLTVTQMEFSHDDSFLLSVSRDRQFSVFSIKRTGGVDEVSCELAAREEAHKRIIWACSWNPFGHEFATGSRDKTVKIWAVVNAEKGSSSVKPLLTLPQFKSSVTALSWFGCNNDGSSNDGLLAVGMESGLIELWVLSGKRRISGHDLLLPEFSASLAVRLDPFMCHVSTVHRVAWRNNHSEKKKTEDNSYKTTIQLASCGADHCVRVYEINV
ncbi:WD40 repeat [Macleaya cordata]|uniref:Elongator complex protein 2 n=1 Tax=Macleaya cordata TaxID=56857 RepID=A0A200QXY9_MACCD|nr:WD40 repeat [Macleaya cordata]